MALYPQEQRQLCKTKKVLFHKELRVAADVRHHGVVPRWNTPGDEIGTWVGVSVALRRSAAPGWKRRRVPSWYEAVFRFEQTSRTGLLSRN